MSKPSATNWAWLGTGQVLARLRGVWPPERALCEGLVNVVVVAVAHGVVQGGGGTGALVAC